MKELSSGDEFRRFGLTAFTTNGNQEPRLQWAKTITEQGGDWGFSADDRVLLAAFAEGIGRSDVAGEIRFCSDYREAVCTHLSSAREELKIKGRLYLTLGMCGGVLAALLLW